MRIKRIKNWN